MDIETAQLEIRRAYLRGGPGAWVSGIVWLVSGFVASAKGVPAGFAVLFFAGMLIFPIATFIVRNVFRCDKLSPANSNGLTVIETIFPMIGATVATVFRQLERIPDDASHLVLSVGGNDALWMAGNIFSQESTDVRSSLQHIAEVFQGFKSEYRRLVCALRESRVALATCTVYDSVPGLGAAESAGLCLFNDTITRTAFEYGTTLIDLRTICNEVSDYSSVSPIEPSAGGGGKIARAIVRALSRTDDLRRVIA